MFEPGSNCASEYAIKLAILLAFAASEAAVGAFAI